MAGAYPTAVANTSRPDVAARSAPDRRPACPAPLDRSALLGDARAEPICHELRDERRVRDVGVTAAERRFGIVFEPELDRASEPLADRAVWTSAGVTTGIDMALAIVERDHGRALADAVAAQLVLYVRRLGFQSQFSAALVAQTASSQPLAATLAWARAHLGTTLAAMARHAGMSLRTFHRRCLDHLRLTPAKVLDRLRVEHARMLLASSQLSAKQVAAKSGFATATQMTAAFRRALGVPPSTYRALRA